MGKKSGGGSPRARAPWSTWAPASHQRPAAMATSLIYNETIWCAPSSVSTHPSHEERTSNNLPTRDLRFSCVFVVPSIPRRIFQWFSSDFVFDHTLEANSNRRRACKSLSCQWRLPLDSCCPFFCNSNCDAAVQSDATLLIRPPACYSTNTH